MGWVTGPTFLFIFAASGSISGFRSRRSQYHLDLVEAYGKRILDFCFVSLDNDLVGYPDALHVAEVSDLT
eukprot:1393921-Amorphochlora_amoeboformis.AAC.1